MTFGVEPVTTAPGVSPHVAGPGPRRPGWRSGSNVVRGSYGQRSRRDRLSAEDAPGRRRAGSADDSRRRAGLGDPRGADRGRGCVERDPAARGWSGVHKEAARLAAMQLAEVVAGAA